MTGQKTIISIFVLFFWGFAFCSTGMAQGDEEFIPGQDSGFYYIVKKGDTLWDLSQKFYDSQWDWPGLWEMNEDIKNPHWIYPGKKIQIFVKKKPALKPRLVKVQKTKKEVEAVKIKTSFSFSKMDHIGFIRKKAQTSLGSIIKEQDNNVMMSSDDIIYIKPSGKETLVPGKSYHIFTTGKIHKKVNNRIFKGVKHLVKARVKILEHKTDYVTALITIAYRPVYEGDMIMEFHGGNSVLIVEDNPAPIDARIICSEDNNVMINDYVIAFIDTGKAQVKPGQIYSIYRKNEARDNSLWPFNKKNSIKFENLKSGKLIVLHTEKTASTVMILSSKYAIHPDDMVN